MFDFLLIQDQRERVKEMEREMDRWMILRNYTKVRVTGVNIVTINRR